MFLGLIWGVPAIIDGFIYKFSKSTPYSVMTNFPCGNVHKWRNVRFAYNLVGGLILSIIDLIDVLLYYGTAKALFNALSFTTIFILIAYASFALFINKKLLKYKWISMRFLNDEFVCETIEMSPESKDINDYLLEVEHLHIIDDRIHSLAMGLISDKITEIHKINAIYEYVRDNIYYTTDVGRHDVSRDDLEVLKNGHGMCYSKSMLLASMLRSVNIPCGFCYQRLILDESAENKRFCVHALNCVYVEKDKKWYRLDARGNKEGVFAEFNDYKKRVAFEAIHEGEIDYKTVFVEPAKVTLEALQKSNTPQELYDNLPTEL